MAPVENNHQLVTVVPLEVKASGVHLCKDFGLASSFLFSWQVFSSSDLTCRGLMVIETSVTSG